MPGAAFDAYDMCEGRETLAGRHFANQRAPDKKLALLRVVLVDGHTSPQYLSAANKLRKMTMPMH